jgi:hypothetical protein
MIRTLALLGLSLCAAPAFAAPTVYSCKIERRIEGQDTQVYSPNLRGDPALNFRFAFDAEAGKGCRLDGMSCMPMFSTLTLSNEGGAIKGSGTRLTDGVPVTLTLFPGGRMAFQVVGQAEGRQINSQTLSGPNDCVATSEAVRIR